MLHPKIEPRDGVAFRTFCVLIFHHTISLLILSFEVHSELICSHEPIEALAGDDVILPCHLEPPISASSETVMWTKHGSDPKHILIYQDGRLVSGSKNPSYYKRTRLFVDELMNGNVSLKIFNVKISDAGKYFCIIDSKQKEASINLSVGAVSTPIIKLVSNNRAEVVLQCESAGWYPEPEVFWLDGEGNLLSAGPTETVRGPDDLYTVSSRVTVEKRHNKNVTCRVHQKNINQTRGTHIHVPAGVFVELSPVKQHSEIFFMCFLLLMINYGFFKVNFSLNWFRGIGAVIVIVALKSIITPIIYYYLYKSVHWIWWISIVFNIAIILITVDTLKMNFRLSLYWFQGIRAMLYIAALESIITPIIYYYLYKKSLSSNWCITTTLYIAAILITIFRLTKSLHSSLYWFWGISAALVIVALEPVITPIMYYVLYVKSFNWILGITIIYNINLILRTVFRLTKSRIKRNQRTVMEENFTTDKKQD